MMKNLPKKTFREPQLKQLIKLAIPFVVGDNTGKKRRIIKSHKFLFDTAPSEKSTRTNSFKGIVFIEFTTHEHAITFLTYLRMNPRTINATKIPIVQFAIDDARKVRKWEDQAKLQRELQEAKKVKKTQKEIKQGKKDRRSKNKASRLIIENILKQKDMSRMEEVRGLLS